MFAGTGTNADWDYCTSARPCPNQKGDCDHDAECVQDHVCGQDNCQDFWNQAEYNADCCIPGDLIPVNDLFLNSVDLDLKLQR